MSFQYSLINHSPYWGSFKQAFNNFNVGWAIYCYLDFLDGVPVPEGGLLFSLWLNNLAIQPFKDILNVRAPD